MMEYVYNLVGFINIFNIIPDFVIPIFHKNHNRRKYYVQYVDAGIIHFDELPRTLFYNCTIYFIRRHQCKIRNLNSLNTNNCISPYTHENCYKETAEAIYAFQNIEEIVYGNFGKLKEYVSQIESEDFYLKEQIDDFVINTKTFNPLIVEQDISMSLDIIKSQEYKHLSPIYINDVIKDDDFIEILDRELRKHSCKSSEYKEIIRIINKLLSDKNGNTDIIYDNMPVKDIGDIIMDVYNSEKK